MKSKWVLIIGAGFVIAMAAGVWAQRRCAAHPGCPLVRLLKPNPELLSYASAEVNDQNTDSNTPRLK